MLLGGFRIEKMKTLLTIFYKIFCVKKDILLSIIRFKKFKNFVLKKWKMRKIQSRYWQEIFNKVVFKLAKLRINAVKGRVIISTELERAGYGESPVRGL